jgi:hypothetical protein
MMSLHTRLSSNDGRGELNIHSVPLTTLVLCQFGLTSIQNVSEGEGTHAGLAKTLHPRGSDALTIVLVAVIFSDLVVFDYIIKHPSMPTDSHAMLDVRKRFQNAAGKKLFESTMRESVLLQRYHTRSSRVCKHGQNQKVPFSPRNIIKFLNTLFS